MESASVVTLDSGRQVYVEKHDRSQSSPASNDDVPILFIHGFMMACDCWHSLLPYLQHYTTILFDHEPHGKTPLSGRPTTIPTLAQDAHDVLAYFGYAKATVVGHSAGALLALQLAADFPQLVKELILIAPVNVPPPDDADFRRQFIRDASMDQLLEIHVSFLAPKARTDPTLCALVTNPIHEQADRRAELEEYFDLIMLFDFRGTAGAKTSVIRATEDLAVPKEVAEGVAQLTNAKVIDIGTGHFPMFEDVMGLADALRQIMLA